MKLPCIILSSLFRDQFFFLREIHKTGIVYSFLLDARGRIVSDVFIYKKDEENFLVETDSITTGKLERLLTIYRVRRKVEIRQTTLDVNFSSKLIVLKVHI